ncbi:DUF3108 domain-containing protein [Dyella sp.]|jgi:hypothetical protein|uniref:DUF3108 domain-containing protein n=1 Tax=Dyella sp. TaxID=1869338 RepID=UPI002C5C6B32|nr:DUF3108 domain-containing protein [Dyella sp.]HTC26754.1 DUF3108 domain-containing protein [Dyella sp.]
MRTLKLSRTLLAGLALATFATAVFAAPPKSFTATYQVLREGEAMGQATITLKSLGNGEYEYSNQMKGTSGLAAMLGVNSNAVTRFRWHNDTPETENYTSKVSALKTKERTMQVNWNSNQVTVTDNKGTTNYAAVPGMVDGNTFPLALGLALAGGSHSVTLPVGVKQQVEHQQYKVQASESVQVPAGTFNAERVARTDSDKHFEAWYVKQYPLPVKLVQTEGGDLTMQLSQFSAN